jgi:hypothetical protein
MADDTTESAIVTRGLKPLFLVKPDTVSKEDIVRAEKQSGICIIECSDPESARFLEPPFDADIDVQARAALSLVRYISSQSSGVGTTFYGANLMKMFLDAVLHWPSPTRVERVKKGK